MIYQIITIAQLSAFLQTPTFQKSKTLPITTHRAVAQLQNPRAHPEDVVLIIALEKEEIVGYIGLLPDDLHEAGKVQHLAWLSCWWVQEGTGNLGIQLFLKAYQAWKRRMVITDFTPHIQTIIQKMRLFHFAPSTQGIRGFMRFNAAEMLPAKKPVFKKVQALLKIGDTLANTLNSGRLKLWKWRQAKRDYHLKLIPTIDKTTALFIQKNQNNESFKRGAKELNWILAYPWVLEDTVDVSDTVRAEADRYYFSALASTFQYYPLQVFKKKQLIGFCFLLNREGHFKLPYVYCQVANLTLVMRALFDFLYQKKAITFTVFQPHLKTFIEKAAHPFFYTRLIPKDFAIGRGLDKNVLNSYQLQDGDGDYGWT